MVTLQHRIGLDRLNRGARQASRVRQVRVGRMVLTGVGLVFWLLGYVSHKVLGGGLYGVGWVAGKMVWPALVWVGLAVKVGWVDARGGARGPA